MNLAPCPHSVFDILLMVLIFCIYAPLINTKKPFNIWEPIVLGDKALKSLSIDIDFFVAKKYEV